MTTFVLVAGAFHGAWAWDAVTALLEVDGHSVHAIDLTGQGERAACATPLTNLSTHIDDVERLVVARDLSDVVLVGHSYSGIVVTGAADRMRHRIAHIVYLDATVPENGMSAVDYAGPQLTQAAVDAAGGDWLVGNFFPSAKFGPFASPGEEEQFIAKLGKHPLAAFFEKVQLNYPPVKRRTFIRSTLDPMLLFEPFARHAQASLDWFYFEVATGHDAMLTAPEDVVSILSCVEKNQNEF